MVINHIHFEVPPCCQGSLTAALCEGEQSRKCRTKKYGSGTQLPRCWHVPGAAAGSCLAGRCRCWCRPRFPEDKREGGG